MTHTDDFLYQTELTIYGWISVGNILLLSISELHKCLHPVLFDLNPYIHFSWACFLLHCLWRMCHYAIGAQKIWHVNLKLCHLLLLMLLLHIIILAQVTGQLEKQGMGNRTGMGNCTKRAKPRRLGALEILFTNISRDDSRVIQWSCSQTKEHITINWVVFKIHISELCCNFMTCLLWLRIESIDAIITHHWPYNWNTKQTPAVKSGISGPGYCGRFCAWEDTDTTATRTT